MGTMGHGDMGVRVWFDMSGVVVGGLGSSSGSGGRRVGVVSSDRTQKRTERCE